jgi:3-oxoacyl-[acyl-carrier protein] reductase
LVTGAGRGVGKRLALGFAGAGARVGLLSRSKAELDLAHLEIEHAGGAALRLRADVRDYEQVQAAIEKMEVNFGAIHVLVCAAGIPGPIGPLAASAPLDWKEAIETNLVGAMHACRAALPGMLRQRSGKIVLISGDGAANPRVNFSAYAAAKAAVARLAETLAEEVRESNIQVNCLDPGGAYSAMTDEILRAAEKAGWREQQTASEIRTTGGVSPEKQIELALFLASSRSNHVSGKIIHVSDDWRRLERANANPALFTLRRVEKF